MKKITFLLLMVFVASIGFAQNIHSVFTNSISSTIVSSTVVSSQSGSTYLIGVDTDQKLFVSELDNSLPTPQPLYTKYFQIPATVISLFGRIMLNGGVVHPNTGEIFVYGYGAQTNTGIFAVIKMTAVTNGLPTSLYFRWLGTTNAPLSDSPITAGCWANNPTPLPTNTAYGIVYNGKLARVLVNNGNPLQINGVKAMSDYKITAVAYDADLNNFVVSGVSDNTVIQAIAYIPSGSTFLSANFTIYILKIDQGTFDLSNHTSTLLLEGNGFYYNQNAVLIHEITYSQNMSMGYWVTNINYLTGATNDYKVYITEDYKTSVIEAADNFAYLYILGTVLEDGDVSKKSILQIDMYNLSNYIWKTMDDFTLIGFNRSYLDKIFFNSANFDVISNGTIYLESYYVETIDLFSDNCDTEIDVFNPYMSFDTATFTNVISSTQSIGTATQSAVNDYTIGGETICSDLLFSNAKKTEHTEKITQIIAENKIKAMYANRHDRQTQKEVIENTKIEIYGNNFIVNNFEGICNYKITDVLGRILQEGTTNNNAANNINIRATGIYLLQISDNEGNFETEKIFVR